MSDYQKCTDAIQEAAGRKLTDDEIIEVVEALQSRQKYLLAKRIVRTESDAALLAAEQIGQDAELAALIQKVNAARNLVKRVEKVEWIKNNFGKNFAEGVEALLVGVSRAKTGARASVASAQYALEKQYLAGFTTDLERTGHSKLFASGAMDREVWLALDGLNKKDAAQRLANLPKEAVEIARVVNKWQEYTRLDANEAGAWIRKNQSYVTHRTHDPEKIRGKGETADYVAWKRNTEKWFDIEAMMSHHGVGNADNMLSGIWRELSTGAHFKNPEGTDQFLSAFKGSSNLAKKISQSRSILFKDGDSSFEYNNLYGSESLRESIVSGLSKRARDVGLLQELGTNPQNMVETIKSDLAAQANESGQVNQVDRFQKKESELDRYMAAVDGSMHIPGNAMMARRSANVRSVISLSKLGGMVFSQLSDLAIYGSGAKYQGRGFFSGMTEAVAGLGRNLKAQETRDVVSSLGVILDNMTGELARVGSFDEAGSLSRMMQTFMKYNLSNWWNTRMQASAALGMSHHMALQSGKAWDAIGPEYQRVLDLYKIDAGQWDLIRSTATKEADGKSFIVPEGVAALPDERIAAYLAASEQSATPDNIRITRDQIERNLRQYFVDQTSIMQLNPDAKTRAIILQGTKPGTWNGELWRFMTQFKSFSIAYMQRIGGRELYGRGYEGDSALKALFAGNGEFQGLAQVIAMSTLLGYGSLALKDLAKGKTPRDPTESPEQAKNVFLAAMVQGGGAGIYGDFLFGQANRFGNTPLESAAGPAIAQASRLVSLWQKFREGEDVSAQAFREAWSNIPFINLFYTKQLLDYLVVHSVQESLSPGYLSRVEADARKNGQEYFMKPSAAF